MHPLPTPYTFTYDYQNITQQNDNKWITALNDLATVQSVGELKGIVEKIPDLKKWPLFSNIQFFKEGIKPAWEDPNNKEGGRIVSFLYKDGHYDINEQWRQTLQYIASNSSNFYDNINGCVFSVRKLEFKIYIWINKNDEKIYNGIIEEIREYNNFSGKVQYIDNEYSANKKKTNK